MRTVTQQTAAYPQMLQDLPTALEQAPALDALAPVYSWLGGALASSRLGPLLHGDWLGHAVHPALSDLPLGFWTSASVLDLVGGRDARRSAQLLVALGLLSAVPTAASGLVEWKGTSREESRVATVHALANSLAVVLYGSSYASRRRGSHLRGAALALVGATVAASSGYLGSHLAIARGAGSRSRG